MLNLDRIEDILKLYKCEWFKDFIIPKNVLLAVHANNDGWAKRLTYSTLLPSLILLSEGASEGEKQMHHISGRLMDGPQKTSHCASERAASEAPHAANTLKIESYIFKH